MYRLPFSVKAPNIAYALFAYESPTVTSTIVSIYLFDTGEIASPSFPFSTCIGEADIAVVPSPKLPHSKLWVALPHVHTVPLALSAIPAKLETSA